MKIAMLRIGIDTGSGGMHGPLLKSGNFEYIPIPDESGIDLRTYGNTEGRSGKRLIDYFPDTRKLRNEYQSIHMDPEFSTFTYGDPSVPKSGLRKLEKGDLLIFYCGLEGWDFKSAPALYLMGYFQVQAAGYASDFNKSELHKIFGENFHVKHKDIFQRQKGRLVLVKGSEHSRLLKKAVKISVIGHDRTGKPLKILSPEMQKIFGGFDGKLSFQRSPTRWVEPPFISKANDFIGSLV